MYHLSMIDSYELGQLLRILLWILLPAVVLFIIINTWLQYRRKWKLADQMFLYEGQEEEGGDVREEIRSALEEVQPAWEEAPTRGATSSLEEVQPARGNWEMDAAN